MILPMKYRNVVVVDTRTTFFDKIVILVNISLFSIKVRLSHLNEDNKSALKINILTIYKYVL